MRLMPESTTVSQRKRKENKRWMTQELEEKIVSYPCRLTSQGLWHQGSDVTVWMCVSGINNRKRNAKYRLMPEDTQVMEHIAKDKRFQLHHLPPSPQSIRFHFVGD